MFEVIILVEGNDAPTPSVKTMTDKVHIHVIVNILIPVCLFVPFMSMTLVCCFGNHFLEL